MSQNEGDQQVKGRGKKKKKKVGWQKKKKRPARDQNVRGGKKQHSKK